MVDLTEELMAINGVAEILWVFAGFKDTDMASMDDSFFVLWQVLRKVYQDIGDKTGNARPEHNTMIESEAKELLGELADKLKDISKE
ncbi:MAG: hypothetical protein DUD30_00610 [Lactobacillus sp.]|nr:MAG: hypothetical protein DUD30_00610 [Lactobacillus sp.]